MEDRGLQEGNTFNIINKNTRFVSSYREAQIITLDEDENYQLSILNNGTIQIYSFGSFEEAYKQYESLLKNDKYSFDV